MNNLKKLGFLLAIAVMILFSCSKDNGEKTPETASTPILKENVKIIDATNLQLDLAPALIKAGVYRFAITGTAPAINAGDVIVGEQGDGFIRKVTSATVDGNTITLQTIQGSMADAVAKGIITFETGMDGLAQGKTAENGGLNFPVNHVNLYTKNSFDITINSGNIYFNPNWKFDFQFDDNGLKSFEMGALNAALNGDFTTNITSKQSNSFSFAKSLLPDGKPLTKKIIKWVPVILGGIPVRIPVVIIFEVNVIADFTASIANDANYKAIFTSTNEMNLGLTYNGQWEGLCNGTSKTHFELDQISDVRTNTVTIGLSPVVKAKLYGVAGPSFTLGLMEELKGQSTSKPPRDWDFKADTWLKADAAVEYEFKILGETVSGGYSYPWESPKKTYSTPSIIEKVSGDEQSGAAGKQLPNPIKVRVLDTLSVPQKKVPVHFKVTQGNGTVSAENVLTDDNGYAEVNWTLGNLFCHKLEAIVNKGNGKPITTAPVTFSAKLSQASASEVTIGSQTWMLKNLDVDHYRNGDPIPKVSYFSDWSKLTTGAWCYYEDNTANGIVYGKLYNWYAMNDPRGLAPPCYHIPTFAEWNILFAYLGGTAIAGGKMKEAGTVHWESPNTDATNSSGFTGLPYGPSERQLVWWWANGETPFFLSVQYDSGGVGGDVIYPTSQCYVRCLKD